MKPVFRTAQLSDLASLVEMLADDPLGATREDLTHPLNVRYEAAFEAISCDPNNDIVVAELDQKVVAMLQTTNIPYLTHTGSWRCLIEGVRVSNDYRGRGLGHALIEYSVECAREKGMRIVQLTTDKTRPEAILFYEDLGFVASHEGMKMRL